MEEPMSHSENTIWCDGCGTEITWVPYVIESQEFCCQNCAYGLSCKCGETMEWDDEYRDASPGKLYSGGEL
jgi:hypothetical protein